MIQSIVFAVVAAAAILIGASIGALWTPPDRLKGVLVDVLSCRPTALAGSFG